MTNQPVTSKKLPIVAGILDLFLLISLGWYVSNRGTDHESPGEGSSGGTSDGNDQGNPRAEGTKEPKDPKNPKPPTKNPKKSPPNPSGAGNESSTGIATTITTWVGDARQYCQEHPMTIAAGVGVVALACGGYVWRQKS